MSENTLLYLLYRNCHLRYSHWDFVNEDTNEGITKMLTKKLKNKIDSGDVMLAVDPILHDSSPVFYLHYFKGEIK